MGRTTARRLLPALVLVLLAPAGAAAQGILLLAHGGRADWNQEVLDLASRVDAQAPVEVAFGMANKRTIRDALERLEARGVERVVAVPLFVSSHSGLMRATEWLLGGRDEEPPQMAIFARMSAARAAAAAEEDDAAAEDDAGFDWATPVESTLPISVGRALDSHALVADILVSRALDVSQSPDEEVLVLVAHGPLSEEDNALWLESMRVLVEKVRARTGFRRIEHLTVRDDAPAPVRDQATAELRAVVGTAVEEGASVVIVPLLLSFGGIERGIRERLEGLPYRMAGQALLPDERLDEWVLMQVVEP